MKRLYVIIMASLFFIFSCTKHSAVTSASFDGTWELTQVSGSFTTNYSPGNGNLLKFSGNNYQMYAAGTLKKSGTYSLMQDTTASTYVCLVFSPGQFNTRIVFDADLNSAKTFAQITGDTLSLVSGCFANDGGSFSNYVRK